MTTQRRAGIFAFGAVLAALLFKRRGQAEPVTASPAPEVTGDEPVAVG